MCVRVEEVSVKDKNRNEGRQISVSAGTPRRVTREDTDSEWDKKGDRPHEKLECQSQSRLGGSKDTSL